MARNMQVTVASQDQTIMLDQWFEAQVAAYDVRFVGTDTVYIDHMVIGQTVGRYKGVEWYETELRKTARGVVKNTVRIKYEIVDEDTLRSMDNRRS